MHLRRAVRRHRVRLALWLAGGVGLGAAQPPTPQMYRACGRVLLIDCAGTAPSDPVLVTLDVGKSAVLQVTTGNVADQQLLRQPREGQHLCFRGSLVRKASATELTHLDALTFYDVQPSDVRKPFAVDAVTTCEPGVQLPKVVTDQKPNYTKGAMQAQLQGSVGLAVLIDTDGRVAKVRVLRPLDRQLGLDDEAVNAAYRWRFTPAMKGDQPVRIVVAHDMWFTLKP